MNASITYNLRTGGGAVWQSCPSQNIMEKKESSQDQAPQINPENIKKLIEQAFKEEWGGAVCIR